MVAKKVQEVRLGLVIKDEVHILVGLTLSLKVDGSSKVNKSHNLFLLSNQSSAEGKRAQMANYSYLLEKPFRV